MFDVVFDPERETFQVASRAYPYVGSVLAIYTCLGSLMLMLGFGLSALRRLPAVKSDRSSREVQMTLQILEHRS